MKTSTMLRYPRFIERLEARLNDLGATGQRNSRRLVKLKLRLLNLLRNAWATVPSSAPEVGRGTNDVGLLLYGEPYRRYTLLFRDNLSVPGWITTPITNRHNEGFITLPMPAPQRYYRALLPVPCG